MEGLTNFMKDVEFLRVNKAAFYRLEEKVPNGLGVRLYKRVQARLVGVPTVMVLLKISHALYTGHEGMREGMGELLKRTGAKTQQDYQRENHLLRAWIKDILEDAATTEKNIDAILGAILFKVDTIQRQAEERPKPAGIFNAVMMQKRDEHVHAAPYKPTNGFIHISEALRRMDIGLRPFPAPLKGVGNGQT